jgi:hypothetical protein
MLFTKLLFATVAAAAMSVPGNAATTLRFTLTGDLDASWTGPASPTVINFAPGFFDDAAVNEIGFFFLRSYSTGSLGGIAVSTVRPGLFNFVSTGPQIFTGPTSNPTYRTGVFALTRFDANRPGNGTLTISAIPEPASWALMIAGFGLVGSALRRRKAVAAA